MIIDANLSRGTRARQWLAAERRAGSGRLAGDPQTRRAAPAPAPAPGHAWPRLATRANLWRLPHSRSSSPPELQAQRSAQKQFLPSSSTIVDR